MKFIKADGTIEEGTPLSDNTAKLRDELEKYLHEVVCGNSYHGKYDKKKCATRRQTSSHSPSTTIRMSRETTRLQSKRRTCG